MRSVDEARLALRNLRHLYEQMLSGHVRDQVSAANGLLSPAIARLERIVDQLDDMIQDAMERDL